MCVCVTLNVTCEEESIMADLSFSSCLDSCSTSWSTKSSASSWGVGVALSGVVVSTSTLAPEGGCEGEGRGGEEGRKDGQVS